MTYLTYKATFKVDDQYIYGQFSSRESFEEKYKKALLSGQIQDDAGKVIQPIKFGCFAILEKND